MTKPRIDINKFCKGEKKQTAVHDKMIPAYLLACSNLVKALFFKNLNNKRHAMTSLVDDVSMHALRHHSQVVLLMQVELFIYNVYAAYP